MKLTKSQRQLVTLGVLMAAIIGVLAFVVVKPPSSSTTETYSQRTVDTAIPDGVLKHPAYRGLSSPVDLPLVPGRTGRDNPFEPY
jgi:hypothetical protein